MIPMLRWQIVVGMLAGVGVGIVIAGLEADRAAAAARLPRLVEMLFTQIESLMAANVLAALTLPAIVWIVARRDRWLDARARWPSPSSSTLASPPRSHRTKAGRSRDRPPASRGRGRSGRATPSRG